MTGLALKDVRLILAGAIGICVLTASSYLSVPMYPVPVTLQTLAVVMIGVVLGPRAGALTVLSWLGLAMAGVPVLAGATGGPVAFVGPTAGYLLCFPFAAFLAGMLPRAENLFQHATVFGAMLALHGLILLAGWAWLSLLIGPETALIAGVVPFLIGGALKAGLATVLSGVLPAAWRL
ncbi:MAG: biotin transporter BioY [Pseudomonadota bacterium]